MGHNKKVRIIAIFSVAILLVTMFSGILFTLLR